MKITMFLAILFLLLSNYLYAKETEMEWYSPDIKTRLELATDYVTGMMDSEKKSEPFFGIHRKEDGTAYAFHAIEIGIPHVTGRALDILFITEETLKKRSPKETEAAYRDYLYSCFDNEDYLPSYYDPRKENKRFVESHNLREGLWGLTRLVKMRDDKKARMFGDNMLLTLEKITDINGLISMAKIKEAGRESVIHGISDTMQTITTGRLVGPLLEYYRVTGNPLALKLAGGYARGVLKNSFTDTGLLTDDASNHIHSITSALSGILEYALMVGDQRMVDKCMLVYEVGLREFMSSYGWVKEQAWLETDQGESNQVGDVIQILLLLAKNRDPKYYSDAERFMRSTLLPQQVIDNSFISETDKPKGDFERNMKNKIIGGFGFATPNSHLQKPFSAINTIDITQGAVQAMCKFTQHIITKDDLGVRVNLLFDWETENAKVKSQLPLVGRVEVKVKVPENLLIRIPENIKEETISIISDGKKLDNLNRVANYIIIPNSKPNSDFVMTFTPNNIEKGEFIYHKHYGVRFYGEQAYWISEVTGIYPIFGAFDISND